MPNFPSVSSIAHIHTVATLSVPRNLVKTIGSTSFTEDFESGTYTLAQFADSPNGKWVNHYYAGTGTGGVRLTTSLTPNSNVFYHQTDVATIITQTFSNLTLSKQVFYDFDMTFKMRTVSQTRTGTAPKAWEYAWIMFRFTDDWHHYYFLLKSDGCEFGRKDYATHIEQQIFVYQNSTPTAPALGTWSTIRIRAVQNKFDIWVDGTLAVSVTDNGTIGTDSNTGTTPAAPSAQMYYGAMGPYNEDCIAEWENFVVSDPAAIITFTDTQTRTKGSTIRNLNQTITPTLTLSDSETRLRNKLKTDSETLTLTQTSINRIRLLFGTISDSLALSDSFSRLRNKLRITSDSLTLTSSLSRITTRLRTIAQSLTLTDSETRLKTKLRTDSETLTLTQTSTNRLTNKLRTILPTLSLSDNISKLKPVASTYSATRLYLHDAANANTGTLPSSIQTSRTSTIDMASSTLNKSMNNATGISQTSITITRTPVASAFEQYYGTRFVSDPLNQTSIGAQTWTINYAISCNPMASTAFPNSDWNGSGAAAIGLYVWRPSTGAKVADIYNGATNDIFVTNRAPGGSTGEMSAVDTTSIAGAAVTCQVNDVICLEIWTGQRGTAVSRTLGIYYDGTTVNTTNNTSVTNHAAYLESASSISYKSGSRSLAQTISDTLAFVSSHVRLTTRLRTDSETLTFVDSESRLRNKLKTDSETLAITHTSTNDLRLLLQIVSDALALSASITNIRNKLRVTSDTLTLTGSPPSRLTTRLRTIAHTLTLSDSITKLRNKLKTIADTLTLSDSLSRTKGKLKTISDSLTLSDSIVKEILARVKTIAQSLTLSDSETRITTRLRTISNTLTLSDSITKTRLLLQTFSDSLTLSDSISRTRLLLQTISDTLTFTSSTSRIRGRVSSIAHTLTLADTRSKITTRLRTIAETLSFLTNTTKLKTAAGPTRLYLHAAANAVSGTFPTTEQSTLTAVANQDPQTTNRSMDLSIGTSQASISSTLALTGSNQNFYVAKWVSQPLLTTSITAQTWTVNVAAKVGDASSGYPTTYNVGPPEFGTDQNNLYIWRPSTGAKVATIFDSVSTGTGTANLGSTVETSIKLTFAGSAATCQAGDVLIFEFWAVTGAAGSINSVSTFYYDGSVITTTDAAVVTNHASYIETPQGISFGTGLQNLNRTISDAVAFVSSHIRSTTRTRTINPTLTFVDSISRTRLLFQTMSDAITLSNVVSRFRGRITAISDALTLSSTNSQSKPGKVKTIADVLAFVQTSTNKLTTRLRTILPTLSLVDLIQYSKRNTKTISETLTFTDTESKSKVKNKTISDAITISAGILYDVIGKVKTISATLTLSDNVVQDLRARVRIISDFISLTHVISKLKNNGVLPPTRLYFHQTLTTEKGLLPSTNQSTYPSAFNVDPFTTNRSMTLAKSSTAQKTLTASLTTTFGQMNDFYITRFISPPLGQLSIAANTWKYSFSAINNNPGNYVIDFAPTRTNTAQGPVHLNVYVWRPSTGAKVGTIVDGDTNNLAQNRNDTGPTQRSNYTTFSGAAVSGMQLTDLLVVEGWIHILNNTASTSVPTWYYDGTVVTQTDTTPVSDHAAFIETPENFSFVILRNLTTTISHSLALVSSHTRIRKFIQTVSDTLTLTSTTSRPRTTRLRTILPTLTLSDSITRRKPITFKTISHTLTIVATHTRLKGRMKSFTDDLLIISSTFRGLRTEKLKTIAHLLRISHTTTTTVNKLKQFYIRLLRLRGNK